MALNSGGRETRGAPALPRPPPPPWQQFLHWNNQERWKRPSTYSTASFGVFVSPYQLKTNSMIKRTRKKSILQHEPREWNEPWGLNWTNEVRYSTRSENSIHYWSLRGSTPRNSWKINTFLMFWGRKVFRYEAIISQNTMRSAQLEIPEKKCGQGGGRVEIKILVFFSCW